jgi:hypothetical protein
VPDQFVESKCEAQRARRHRKRDGREGTTVARRLIWLFVASAAVGCAPSQSADEAPVPALPLPVTAMAGVEVVVYPLTMILGEAALGWDELLSPRDSALRVADSLIARALTERTPEVMWVLPEALRRVARRAPGILVDPDRMATATLRHNLSKAPDPLRSQMRALTGAVGDRLSLVPTSLLFFQEPDGTGRAELMIVLVDVRLGDIWWRSVVRGAGPDPWTAFREALETLAPVL